VCLGNLEIDPVAAWRKRAMAFIYGVVPYHELAVARANDPKTEAPRPSPTGPGLKADRGDPYADAPPGGQSDRRVPG